MPALRSVFLYIAALLASISIALFYASHHQQVLIQPPIRLPIQLISGSRPEGAFVPKLADDGYIIALEFQRNIPFDALSSIVNPKGEASLLKLSWELSSESTGLVTGHSADMASGGLWGRSVLKPLGRVSLTTSQTYRLRAHVESTVEALTSTDPHLLVTLHPARAKGFWVNHTLYRYAGGITGVLSLLTFVLWVWRVWLQPTTVGEAA